MSAGSNFNSNEVYEYEKISQDELIDIISRVSEKRRRNSTLINLAVVYHDNCGNVQNFELAYSDEQLEQLEKSGSSELDEHTEKESSLDGSQKTGKRILMWEFCRDILKNPETNPSLLSWIDKKKLVFKIENPEVVAKEWEIQKGSKNRLPMTYDTMTRGMRDGIGRHFFAKTDGQYGCHYIRQFGERASNSCSWLKSLKEEN